MSYLSEHLQQTLRNCMRWGGFQEFRELLDALPPTADFAQQTERQKLRGWMELAVGNTEEAYRLFQSAPFDQGARFGILALTVLAGQVSTAVQHWQQYCQTLGAPPVTLPDGPWHAKQVCLAMIAQLQRYPFAPRSPQRGAAGLYIALLYQTMHDSTKAFLELSKVVDFFPMAALVRDNWLEEIGCLPSPLGLPQTVCRSAPASSAPLKDPLGTAEEAVQSAARLLLYLDPDRLEQQCREALEAKQWAKALEFLRRLLTLNPQHTPSLERRWRLHLQMGNPEEAQSDLSALVEIYEKEGRPLESVSAAHNLVELFPKQELTLLKMCFLQARLANPIQLAHYGRELLTLCLEHGLDDRHATYRLWLLRQDLSLDDKEQFRG